ncbi:50S ribosomal protein L4 [Mycoplasma sp. CAG:776]|nr:50S ribosomal protein L4 [Thomasclavelia sp.]CDF11715.1 50S ribosomal protein L4 [Mycoplasma sp. CAG:776]
MKISVKNTAGEKVKDLTLNDAVWNIESNDLVLKKMIKLQLDSMRQGTHKTKTRSEVSGGGRKPWRQKGTGRARQGSIRAAQWRGGGIVFGVTPRDYTFKINRKERALALKSALSLKAQNKELVVIDNINLNSLKTKDVKNLIRDLNLEGKVLFVTSEDNENLYMATRNLGYVYTILANEINAFDLVNANVVVCDEAAVKNIEEVLK